MAKKVILEAGRTFSEFSLLTDYTSKDCNLNRAAKRVIWGKLINNGQVCIARDYILVD